MGLTLTEPTEKLCIDIALQPKQAQLLDLVENSPATWIGYGGSRGGAKSHGARTVQLLRRLKHPHTGGGIFRRTYSEIRENHIEPLLREHPVIRDWYNVQEREVKFPNGSWLRFRHIEHPQDIYTEQGKEYADESVDEATQWTEDMLVYLKTCNRWPSQPDFTPKMVCTMNPGGIGHAFINRVFLQREYRGKENPSDYAFLSAYGWDNIEWVRPALLADSLTEKDYYSWTDQQRFDYFISRSDYGRELDRLPEALRIGHLMGRWDIFAGQYFDIYDPARHKVRAETLGLQPWWPRWIGMDWGFAHNAVVLWNAQDGDRTITYRELAVNRTGEREIAEQIIALSEKDPVPDAFYLSPDAFAKRDSNDTIAERIGEVMRQANFPLPAPADNERIGGWRLMYELLAAGQWVIADNCTTLLQQLPLMVRDDKNVEDVMTMPGQDDAADAARYALKTRLAPGRIPIEQRIEQHITSPDPSIRQIQYQVALHKERQSQPGPVPMRRPWMARRWARGAR